jgi:membrane-bound serine protease (ClpP class)
VIPGVVGVFCVLLVLYALHFLPFSSMALVMVALSFVVFALEAKYHSHGFLTIAGIVLLTLGGLLLVDGPIPQMRVSLWAALGVSLPTALITIFLMSIALKARRNKVATGEQGMVGEIGVVTTPLTPAGKVFVQGEIWNAVASANLEVGQRVVVRRVENLVLQVEPLRELVPQASNAG